MSEACPRWPSAGSTGGHGAGEPGQREPGTEDRQADTRAAVEDLLEHQRRGQPGLVLTDHRVVVQPVEPDLGGLLDHGPGELLDLVEVAVDRDPVDRGLAHLLAGEVGRPVAREAFLLGQLEVEGHRRAVLIRGVRGRRGP